MKLFGSITELVAAVFRKDSQAVTLRPNQSVTYTASRDIQTPAEDAASVLVSRTSTDTLTNKTLTSPTISGSPTVSGATISSSTLSNTNTVTVKDASFTIQDDADVTKQAQFQASSISTGTTRTYTLPDASTTIVGTGVSQSLTSKTLDNTNTVTLKDTLFTLQDDGDTTKQAKFQLSGITTGTTRTYTLPDSSGTVLLSTQATFADNAFTLQDDGDATKQLQFQLSGITTGTTRTLTVPNASGTLALLGTAQTFSADQTFSGTTDASSSTTGTVIISGGVGIAKKLYVGTGVYLPSTGGTATQLNHYEEGTIDLSTQLTGFSSNPSGTAKFTRVGNVVILHVPAFTATSNNTVIRLTIPIRPSITSEQDLITTRPTDNGAIAVDTALAFVNSTNTYVDFRKTAGGSTWTNSGTKGFDKGMVLTWLIA